MPIFGSKRNGSHADELPVVTSMPVVGPRKSHVPRSRQNVAFEMVSPDPNLLMGGDSLTIMRSADRRALWTFAVVLFSAVCLHSDQNLASPNLTAIAQDFGFNEVERDAKVGALVQFGFFMVGGLAAIIFGPIADTTTRRIKVMAAVVVAGNLPCLLTPLIPHGPEGFYLYLFSRVFTGISIGGSFPLLYSICADLFPANKRTFIATAVHMAIAVGQGVGQVMSGRIGPAYGWRWPFFVVAVPSVFSAFLLWFFVPEPIRSEEPKKASYGSAKSPLTVMKEQVSAVLRVATNRRVFLQGFPTAIALSVNGTFLADYLANEKQMTVQGASTMLLFSGLFWMVWVFIGGFFGQWLYNRSPKMVGTLFAVVFAASVLPFWTLLWAEPGSLTVDGVPNMWCMIVCVFLGISGVASPSVRGVLLNVNDSTTRGTVFSGLTLMEDVGKGLGPTVVVFMISLFGRDLAFLLSYGMWFLSALILFTTTWTIGPDLESLRARSSVDLDEI